MAVARPKAIATPQSLSDGHGSLFGGYVRLLEENAGKTNSSLVRFEGNAVFGVERQNAAVRVAAS